MHNYNSYNYNLGLENNDLELHKQAEKEVTVTGVI